MCLRSSNKKSYSLLLSRVWTFQTWWLPRGLMTSNVSFTVYMCWTLWHYPIIPVEAYGSYLVISSIVISYIRTSILRRPPHSVETFSSTPDAAIRQELKNLFRCILFQFQYPQVGNTVFEYPRGTFRQTHRFGTNVFQIFNPLTSRAHCLYTTFKVTDEHNSDPDVGNIYLTHQQSNGFVIAHPSSVIIEHQFTLTELDVRELWEQLWCIYQASCFQQSTITGVHSQGTHSVYPK